LDIGFSGSADSAERKLHNGQGTQDRRQASAEMPPPTVLMNKVKLSKEEQMRSLYTKALKMLSRPTDKITVNETRQLISVMNKLSRKEVTNVLELISVIESSNLRQKKIGLRDEPRIQV